MSKFWFKNVIANSETKLEVVQKKIHELFETQLPSIVKEDA
jgi:hypothetical protein